MCYNFIYRESGEKQKGSLDRILNIWEDRGVYKKEEMKNLRQDIGKNESVKVSHDVAV